MPARRLILNADDLGLWPSVDHGIFTAWDARAVSDSSVFATAPNLPQVLDAARAHNLPTGIHLNLTYGRPLSDPAEIPALVAADGRFMRRQQWVHPLPTEQVQHELTRQVERVRELGWSPTHLDSHHHVHRYPEVLEVVITLATSLHLPVRAVDAAMYEQLTAAGVVAPACFSMVFYDENATVATLMALVEACPHEVLEIMTHPGYAAEDLPSSYRTGREQELAALTAPHWRAYCVEHAITLVSFRDLG